MAGIFYGTTNSGIDGSNAQIGKLETPLKMIIQHESDYLATKKGACDYLFNVQKSNNFGETVVGMDEFNTFDAVEEGNGAPNDEMGERYKKFIEHIQFMKEFTITANMMEDSKTGVAAEARRRAENFVRAYYKTRNKICALALANGTATTMDFGGKNDIDLKTSDGNPLFYKHTITSRRGKSANNYNYYWGSALGSASEVEAALGKIAVALRNMKDENGDPLGYTADTIILPGNRGAAESFVKKALGTDAATGSGNNDINIQYGNWNLVILPEWQSTDDRMIVMSSEANKNLAGNMFFNRIPLTVSAWVDKHTGNYIWNGRCRFGLGFATYKHAMLVVDADSDPTSGAAAALSSL